MYNIYNTPHKTMAKTQGEERINEILAGIQPDKKQWMPTDVEASENLEYLNDPERCLCNKRITKAYPYACGDYVVFVGVSCSYNHFYRPRKNIGLLEIDYMTERQCAICEKKIKAGVHSLEDKHYMCFYKTKLLWLETEIKKLENEQGVCKMRLNALYQTREQLYRLVYGNPEKVKDEKPQGDLIIMNGKESRAGTKSNAQHVKTINEVDDVLDEMKAEITEYKMAQIVEMLDVWQSFVRYGDHMDEVRKEEQLIKMREIQERQARAKKVSEMVRDYHKKKRIENLYKKCVKERKDARSKVMIARYVGRDRFNRLKFYIDEAKSTTPAKELSEECKCEKFNPMWWDKSYKRYMLVMYEPKYITFEPRRDTTYIIVASVVNKLYGNLDTYKTFINLKTTPIEI